jgi:hypothetical protein
MHISIQDQQHLHKSQYRLNDTQQEAKEHVLVLYLFTRHEDMLNLGLGNPILLEGIA